METVENLTKKGELFSSKNLRPGTIKGGRETGKRVSYHMDSRSRSVAAILEEIGSLNVLANNLKPPIIILKRHVTKSKREKGLMKIVGVPQFTNTKKHLLSLILHLFGLSIIYQTATNLDFNHLGDVW